MWPKVSPKRKKVVFFQVYILWPSFRPNGDPLLYLASQPTVEGGHGKCDFVTEVNPFQVKVKCPSLNVAKFCRFLLYLSYFSPNFNCSCDNDIVSHSYSKSAEA
jgi:hypothetical protein